VRVAEYLDRPQMITRSGDNALELAEFDRWGEPLGESITRVLMGDLGALLGTDRVERWRNARHADVSVEVDVQRFDGPASGPVALVAHWRVRRGDDGVERISRISEPLNGSGHAAQAAAMSRALRELSREIVTALAAP
jgi:uncharacterized lipoprotein YmbA